MKENLPFQSTNMAVSLQQLAHFQAVMWLCPIRLKNYVVLSE